MRFTQIHFQLNIQTADGSVDVHVSLPQMPHQDDHEVEWVHGRNISGNFNTFGPTGSEILVLGKRLHNAHVGWV